MRAVRTLLLPAALACSLAAQAQEVDGQAQEVDGQAVFVTQGCAGCHAVPAAGLHLPPDRALSAPPLEGLAEQYRKRWLRRWLRRQKIHEGFTHLKAFDGSEEELEALVDWLLEH